jgi:hypothetical protein
LGACGWKKPLQGHPASWKKPRRHFIRAIMYITLLQTCRFFVCGRREYQCHMHVSKMMEKMYLRTYLSSTCGWKP